MEKVKLIYKEIGETPLEAINKFRNNNLEYKDIKIAYAGRLDPMANGALLLLIDEECKKRDLYQGLNKVYEFEIIVGIETDTYDILGLTTRKAKVDISSEEDIIRNLKTTLETFIGKIMQKYPPYSSYNINSKPLFWYAKNNLLSEITIPIHQVEIFQLEFIRAEIVKARDLKEKIISRLNLVHGDFRQDEIKANWESNLSEITDLIAIKCRAEVSSGTYVRQLVKDIADKLNIPMTTLEIYRKSVGEFSL